MMHRKRSIVSSEVRSCFRKLGVHGHNQHALRVRGGMKFDNHWVRTLSV